MLLERVTPNPFENYDYRPSEEKVSGHYQNNYTAIEPHPYGHDEWTVCTRFERFGGAKHRRSDFAVSVSWKDVESIIEALCEAGCPEALAIRDARKLATAAKELGWQAPGIAAKSRASAA